MTKTTTETCHEAWLIFAQEEYNPDHILNEYNRAFLAGWEAREALEEARNAKN